VAEIQKNVVDRLYYGIKKLPPEPRYKAPRLKQRPKQNVEVDITVSASIFEAFIAMQKVIFMSEILPFILYDVPFQKTKDVKRLRESGWFSVYTDQKGRKFTGPLPGIEIFKLACLNRQFHK
jgi:hypothetical protein